METEITLDNQKFFCEKCQFKTNNKYDYSKHVKTNKHIKNNIIEENQQTPKKYICKCGKEYNDRAGLWKHKNKKKCDDPNNIYKDESTIIKLLNEQTKEINEQRKDITELSGFFKTLIEDNREFHKNLIDLYKTLIKN